MADLDFPIIDCHTHLTRKSVYTRGNKKQLISSMRRAEVDKSFIIAEGVKTPLFYDTSETLDIIGDNKELKMVAALSLSYDDLEDDQMKHLKYLDKNKQICGLKLYPGYEYFYPSDERLEPFYSFAARMSLPVIVHSGDLYTKRAIRPPLLKYSHPLHIDEAAALHPRVTFIIAHVGSPWMADAAEVIYKNENVYADVSGLLIQPDDDGLPNYQELPVLRHKMEETFSYIGTTRRFLFGTDWPLVDQEFYLEFFREMIPKDEQQDFFGGTALKLFKIGDST